MNPPAAQRLEDFASIRWAIPYLESPDWVVGDRTRGMSPNDEADRFAHKTLRGQDCVQHWLELYQKPAPDSNKVVKSISLIKFGTGIDGFPGICHGGAVMAFMDEALGLATAANEILRHGSWINAEMNWRQDFKEGKPLAEVLKGFMVTATCDVKFLRPVRCPGVIGIETDVLENTGNKIKMRAVMKDGEGRALVQADSWYIRIGAGAKL